MQDQKRQFLSQKKPAEAEFEHLEAHWYHLKSALTLYEIRNCVADVSGARNDFLPRTQSHLTRIFLTCRRLECVQYEGYFPPSPYALTACYPSNDCFAASSKYMIRQAMVFVHDHIASLDYTFACIEITEYKNACSVTTRRVKSALQLVLSVKGL